MKCVMLMFDSLNRHMLPPYNRDTWVHAPNFTRLAERAVTFDTSYVCSMPCMPTRRDFHTGRLNFFHCGWGPLEPFDDSVPEMLGKAGIYTHLDTDHYHYFEDGGATYHGRYSSYQSFRGQEGDAFIGQVEDPVVPTNLNGKGRRSDWVNREHLHADEQYPQTQTVEAGLAFMDRNAKQDAWFLQIECFDPHEPFTCHRRYRDLYPPQNDPAVFDWPGYRPVQETPEQVADARHNYAALVSKCDASLGDVLDKMDAHDLWQDTMLIVWTDHGFLLGEHDCWAKNWPPLYEEIAHTPLFIHDPRHPKTAGQRRSALVQPGCDLGPTLLRLFGQETTPSMTGADLEPVIAQDEAVHDAVVFGYHGKAANITDGRYVYMRDPVSRDGLNLYTLTPMSMRGFKKIDDRATLARPFDFTKGMPVLKLPVGEGRSADEPTHRLFDLEQDPKQQGTIADPALEAELSRKLADIMARHDAPPEYYARLGLDAPAAAMA